MKPFDFVQLALLALGGEVRGKTNLQKKVYFLGELTGRLDDLGYRAHFYGPYSDDVAISVDDLKAIGFVDQNVVTGDTVDESGFERRRYDYQLTGAGRRVAESKCRQNAELWKSLHEAAQLLQSAGEVNYMQLSIAAKTYFLLGEKHTAASNEELARLASRFGWRVSPEEVQHAASYLKRLGLVTTD